MSQMKELYGKVAGDSTLQAKFIEIMKGAEEAGEFATGEKLVAFAKETGHDVTLEEIQEYFKNLFEKKGETLSEEELDSVAGGKIGPGGPGITSYSPYCQPPVSIFSCGY